MEKDRVVESYTFQNLGKIQIMQSASSKTPNEVLYVKFPHAGEQDFGRDFINSIEDAREYISNAVKSEIRRDQESLIKKMAQNSEILCDLPERLSSYQSPQLNSEDIQ